MAAMPRAGCAVMRKPIALCAVLALLALFPLAGATFYTELVTKVMILAIFALSLDLLVGYTGLVSFGHAAYYGVGAYTLGLLAPKYEAASLWLTLPAAMFAAGLAALVVGVFVVRVKGIYFIMVTLAFAQMFYFVFHDTKFGGGSDGISMNFKPVAAIGGFTPVDLANATHVYYFVLVLLAAVFLFLRACCARRSAARCRASAATSTACARSGFPCTGTSSRASRSPARSPGSPATCRRCSSASSIRSFCPGTSPATCC